MPSTAPEPESLSKRKQLAQTYRMAKRTDTKIGLWILGAFLLGFVVGGALFWFLPGPDLPFGIVGGIVVGVLFALIIFGRRAQKAAYAQMEGQVGSAAGALQMLRRGWKVDPAVAFTRQQDVVHRVVGPPGIVLVGEGNANRLRGLMATEKRRHERVVSGVPVSEVVCGNGTGEVPLDKLSRHVQKMDKALKPADMTDILGRLRALDATKSAIPLPKGPMPTSMKGQRQNMRGR